MFNKQRLLQIVVDPLQVDEVFTRAKEAVGTFPKNCCAAVCSQFLRKAGMEIPLVPGAQDLANRLRMIPGWRRIPADQPPQPGDVFVSLDIGQGIPGADHIGIVFGPRLEAEFFDCIDNTISRKTPAPYKRNIGKGSRTPVDYWLRYSQPPG